MRPVVCVPCRLFFKPKKLGVTIGEGMPDGIGGWQAYKLWQGDLWACAGCGAEIIRGFGQRAIAEHFQAGYAQAVQACRPLFRVDDC